MSETTRINYTNVIVRDILPVKWISPTELWELPAGPQKPVKEVRYVSGSAIYVERLMEGRWVGCYWSADGQINVPYEGWTDDAFLLRVDREPLSAGWSWVSGTEAPPDEAGGRHFVVELWHEKRRIGVRVHTLLDGTPVLTRWLEITNHSDVPAPLIGV